MFVHPVRMHPVRRCPVIGRELAYLHETHHPVVVESDWMCWSESIWRMKYELRFRLFHTFFYGKGKENKTNGVPRLYRGTFDKNNIKI